MPDSTLSRRSAALLRLLLRKTHKFHTETAEEPFFSYPGYDIQTPVAWKRIPMMTQARPIPLRMSQRLSSLMSFWSGMKPCQETSVPTVPSQSYATRWTQRGPVWPSWQSEIAYHE